MPEPTRLCGRDCPTPDLPHRDPEPDWIGDWPISHGESEHEVPGTGGTNYDWGVYSSPDAYCLCGHPNYLMCPGVWSGEGTVFGMTVEPSGDTP